MQVKWSRRARADLLAIVDYIDLDNPVAARAVLQTIRKRAGDLKNQPDMGRGGRVAGTRELILSRYDYLLVYRRGRETVEIQRVLHQHQQWPIEKDWR